MTFELLDSSGVSLDSFDSQDLAVRAFIDMVKADPLVAENVAILEIDGDGTAIGRVEIDGQVAALTALDG